jgi:broad specificity phosphatase PhoE
MLIYFIRHAESEYNIDNNITHKDCGITSKGESQCIKTCEELKNDQFDLVICSPLKRCKQTCERLKLNSNKVDIDYDCREHIQHVSDLMEGEEVVYETEEKVIKRTNEFKQKLLNYEKQYNYKKIAVVSHADFIFYFTSNFTDGEHFGIWLTNAECWIVNTDEL